MSRYFLPGRGPLDPASGHLENMLPAEFLPRINAGIKLEKIISS
jgi:hypothetical protein